MAISPHSLFSCIDGLKGHPVSSVPVDQGPLGSVGAVAFPAGAQASAVGYEQENTGPDFASLK